MVNTGLNIEQATSGACSTLRPVFSGDIKMAAHKDAQNIERQLHHEMQSVRLHLPTSIPVFLIIGFCSHCTETHLLTSKRLARTCQLERELHNVAVHCRQIQEKKNKKGEIRPCVYIYARLHMCL